METFFIDQAMLKGLVNFRKYLETTTELKLQDMPVVAMEQAALQSASAARMVGLQRDEPEPFSDAQLLKVDEVAQRLGYKKQYVYEMIRTGELPSVRYGKYVRIRPSDLRAWIDKHRE